MLKVKFVALAAVLVIVAACASDPKVRWAQAQETVNDISEQARNLREPCLTDVNDPNCVLTQEQFVRIDSLLDTVELNLDRYRDTGKADWLEAAEDGVKLVIQELNLLGV